MTPVELKSARQSLGLSCAALQRLLGYGEDKTAKTARRWESGSRVPGPVAVMVTALVHVPGLREFLAAVSHRSWRSGSARRGCAGPAGGGQA